MVNFTPELVATAKSAKSAEELFALAKANGVDLTEDEARTYFEQLHTNKELADDELDSVVGGSGCFDTPLTVSGLPEGTRVEVVNGNRCPKCKSNVGFPRRKLVTRNGIKQLLTEVEIFCYDCNEVILGEVYEEDIVRI